MKKLNSIFKISILLFLCLFFTDLPLSAQRKMEKLDRGVVAVRNSSSNYFVSWRYLATDPEDIQFNLYAKKTGGSFTKLNTTIAAACNAPCSISLDLDTIAVAGNGDIIANNRTAIFIPDKNTCCIRTGIYYRISCHRVGTAVCNPYGTYICGLR